MQIQKVDSALSLARRGFHVFPLQANSKKPAVKDFPRVATTDEKQIREWWTMRPHANIGISTSSFNGGMSSLLAVDVDNKGNKQGTAEVLKLEIEGFEFPPTFTQRTTTGGLHYFYKTAKPFRQSAGLLAPGIDTRADGGYVVGAGSTLDGKLYTIEPGPEQVYDVPIWLADRFGSSASKALAIRHVSPLEINTSSAYARAKEWLATAPIAVQGANGDQHTFATAAKVKDFGLGEKECFDLLSEAGGWNERCQPPWGPGELWAKVQNAYAYGKDPIGVNAPEMQFKPIKPENPPPSSGEFYLDKMNKDYALIYLEGSHFIMHETKDEKGRAKRVFYTEVSFKRKFSTFTVQEGKGRPRSWAENWLEWPSRREYEGLCFAPEKQAPKGYFNLWSGFSVKPLSYEKASDDARRGFDIFMEHLLMNICNGDNDLCAWLLGYFAHLIQRPFERPLTTLVFRGMKGTGKNAPIDRVGKLLGRGHYLVAHNSRYLTSNFNGHMDSCLCLVLDEAFWSGDKSAEGILKGITTAPEIIIERKGKEPYMVDNLTRIIVIGNEDWLVPASADERRYAVFDVGNGRMQDHQFFEDMRILIDDKGGNAVLLDYFKNFDLSTVNVNKAPATEALYDQKIASQDTFFSWWLDCLTEGRILNADFGNEWPRDIGKDTLRQAYARYFTETRSSKKLPSKIAFSRFLQKCSPSTVLDQKKRDGEHTAHVFRLPELKDARMEWDTLMDHKGKWREDENEPT